MNSINKTSLTLFAFSKNDTTCSFEASSRGPSKRGNWKKLQISVIRWR